MELPERLPRRLPFLLIPDGVLLPGASMRFTVKTRRNMTMVKSQLLSRSSLSSTIIGILPYEPLGPDELEPAEPRMGQIENRVGCAAAVVQVTGTRWPRPSYSLLVTGLARVTLDRVVQESPFPVGEVTQIEVPLVDAEGSLQSRMVTFKEKAMELLELLEGSRPAVRRIKGLLDSLPAHLLADIVASVVKTSYVEKLDILNSISLKERFEKAYPLLERQLEGYTKKRAQTGEKENEEKEERRLVERRSPLWTDVEEEGDEIQELENRLRAAQLPEKALKAAAREFKRLKKMSPQMPEYPMLRHYLELVTELPWNKSSEERLVDIQQAREDLDADHYALDSVKKRVLEFLAVRKLNPQLTGPILCFAGPPGVGKTSIAKSIARTLGREFHRISLGGVADQSDIRGHRRTYIGSMPGRLIQGVKATGVNNPVFLLDEVDKMTPGIHGDPSAALLEVLDPEQNSTFVDHYLGVPFDLSQVLFIATANDLKTVSRPLRDRMEIIPIAGYSLEDKLPIAKRHLLPRQRLQHGLAEEDVEVGEEVMKEVVQGYTQEAGVRTLERQLGALCRAVAVTLAEEGKEKAKKTHNIDLQFVEKVLGQPQFSSVLEGRMGVPGVALGLAWTQVGGKVMVVEASKVPTHASREGKLKLTGQLGSVMRESAELALSWIRSHAKLLGLEGNSIVTGSDIHLHFPAGAVEKDGPSAGVTIATTLVSLLTGRLVRTDLAMTGEISLHGLVLPVGGVRDKVLGAHRAGLTTVILPAANTRDLQAVPDNVKDAITFIPAGTLEEVLTSAFPGGLNLTPPTPSIEHSKL